MKRKAKKASSATDDETQAERLMRDSFRVKPGDPCYGDQQVTAFFENLSQEMCRGMRENVEKKWAAADEEEKKVKAFEKKVMKCDFPKVVTPKPVKEDCGICCHRLPRKLTASAYLPCCGKEICKACWARNASFDAMNLSLFDFMPGSYEEKRVGQQNCPFCRSKVVMVPETKEENAFARDLLRQRVDEGKGRAMFELAKRFQEGDLLPRQEMHEQIDKGTYRIGEAERSGLDEVRAMELYRQAADSGFGEAYFEFARLARQADQHEAYLENIVKAAECGCPEAVEKLADLSFRKGLVSYAIPLYKFTALIGHGSECMKQLETIHEEGFLSSDDLKECREDYELAKKEMFSKEREAMAKVGGYTARDGSIIQCDQFM